VGIKFGSFFDSSTLAILRFRSHERPKTQTFTLELIARSYEIKFVTFAIVKSQKTKAARQTRAKNAWPTYQC